MLEFLQNHTQLIGLILAAAGGILVFFASKDAFKRRPKNELWLVMPTETAERLEKLCQEVERLKGAPVTMEELFAYAIETYAECVRADQEGREFFLVDDEGKMTPWEIFEKPAA